MLGASTAAIIVDAAAVAILVLGVVLAGTRSIGRAVWIVALQSALGGVAAIAVGLAADAGHLVFGGVLAVSIKGIVVPLFLGAMLRRSTVRRERHLLLDRRLLLVAAVAIVFVAHAVADGSAATAGLGATRALPAAIAAVLTGLLVIMTRRKALSLIVGLLAFENGIALAAFALTYGMPLVVELGVIFDLLIAVVVAWVYAGRMLETMGGTSTDQLRRLRG
jgi:hydrogenase-4 component E